MTRKESFDKVRDYISKSTRPILFGTGSLGDFFLYFDQSVIKGMDLIFWCDFSYQNKICQNFVDHFKINSCIVGCNEHAGLHPEYREFFRNVCSYVCHFDSGILYNNTPYDRWKVIKMSEANNYSMYKSETRIMSMLPKNYIIVCPHGSIYINAKKRLFFVEEFKKLVKFAEQYNTQILLSASKEQFATYDNFNTMNHLQFENYNSTKITISDFLGVMQNANYIISPDTGLKTLASCAGIHTLILRTRDKDNNYLEYGGGNFDHYFLNPRIWKTQKLCTYDEILNHIKNYELSKNKKNIKML